MVDFTVQSTSEEGYATESRVDEFAITVDAAEEVGPSPNKMLVATYASCFLPAFRVGAQQRGFDDVGTIVIDSEAEIDEDDDLSSIAFHIQVEADLEGDVEEIVDRAEDICHVHAAVRPGLRADIEVTDDAF